MDSMTCLSLCPVGPSQSQSIQVASMNLPVTVGVQHSRERRDDGTDVGYPVDQIVRPGTRRVLNRLWVVYVQQVRVEPRGERVEDVGFRVHKLLSSLSPSGFIQSCLLNASLAGPNARRLSCKKP